MPELPEVESVRRELEHGLKDQPKIRRLRFFRKDLRTPLPIDLSKSLVGQRIQCVRRRAKFLLIETEDQVLISHLGMSGFWRFSATLERKPHDHIAFEFFDGRFLIYQDPRRFGVFEATRLGGENTNKWLKNLGVEPLEKDWTGDYLWNRSRKKQIALKNLLLDQRVVAGLGNIYVSEALFEAGLSPKLASHRLNRDQSARLVAATKETLFSAIEYGGTTLKDYLRPDGGRGGFQNRLSVYGREGEKCLRCARGVVKRIVQSGRSTYYCPLCQKA